MSSNTISTINTHIENKIIKSKKNVKKLKERNKITNYEILSDSDNPISDNIDMDVEYDIEDTFEYIHIIHEKFRNYQTDTINKYIVKDNIHDFNSKSIMCYYLWSGINDLDKWELNRKINNTHVNKIYKELVSDYKKKREFIFYEPIHLALKKDNIFYVIDGQHRVLAYDKLYKKNKYPIQKIPCIIWFPENDEEFLEIFDKINSRTPIDRTKLFNYKILDITTWMEKNMGNQETIWGKLRPKINKDLFVEKMRNNDLIHQMETQDIINKINNYNIKLRGMGRNKRCDKYITDSIHNHAETMDFYLGYDKELNWINEL